MTDVDRKAPRQSAELTGLGASHQTGWTALVATLAQIFGTVDARAVLESDRKGTTALHGSVGRARGQ